MMPSLLASLYVNGWYHWPSIGRPTRFSVVRPRPMIRDTPVVGSMPRSRMTLLLCEPFTVRSQPNRGVSNTCRLSVASWPVFLVEPTFWRRLVTGDPDDAAIGTAIREFVLVLR